MSLNIIIDADVAGASRKIENFAKDSRIALTNLSLVVQDLPYGFIGIQNNLPFLAKSFNDLSRASGGTLGALKELGKSLIGPAGLFLAFSTVTSAITFAVQKYGSLGNAVDALFAKNSALIQRQNELNKALAESGGNTAGETAKIQILTKTLNDLSLSNDKRLAAYVELKKISPDIVAGVKQENALTTESINLINKNSEARLNYLQLRAREVAITNQLNNLEEQRLLKEQEYIKLLSDRDKAQKSYNATNKQLYDGTVTFGAPLKNKEFTALTADNYALEQNRLARIDLFNAQKELIDQLRPLLDGTSEYDYRIKNLNDSIKETKKSTQEFTFESFKLWYNKDLVEFVKNSVKSWEKFWDNLEKTTTKRAEKISKALEKFRTDQKDPFVAKGPGKFVPSKEEADRQKALKKIVKDFEETRNLLQGIFFNPLEELFTNFFETGKFAFKEFGDAVLKEIQRIVARIIASKIIELLANILVPGSGQVLQGLGLTQKAGDIIGQAVSGRNLGRPRPQAFNPGGINLGGQVALVLRGQDLVASINRTNTTINRVG